MRWTEKRVTPADRKVLRRAARDIAESAKSSFDACKGGENEPFACGTCPVGNDKCAAEHKERMATVKALYLMARS